MKRKLKNLYLKVRMAITKSPSAILMLHSVDAKENDHTGVNLSRERFLELLNIVVNFDHIDDVVTGEKTRIALSFDDGRSDIYDEIYPCLKKMKIPFTIFVTYNLLGRKGYLTKKQLIELANDELVTIGSHCMNHTDLSQNSVEIQFDEIAESKRLLEELCKTQVDYIAYPYGQYNQDTIEVMKNSELYKYGFIAGGWFWGKNKNKWYALERMNMSNRYYKENLDLLKSLKKRM